MRRVSIALMKSQTPSATLTGSSIAPTPFISGIARFGSCSAARAWAAIEFEFRSSCRRGRRRSARTARGSRAAAASSAAESSPSLLGIEPREQPLAGRLLVDPQAAGRMGIAGDAPLLLAPPQRPASSRSASPWSSSALGAGIGLVLEVQQADMPQRLRAEAADFQVVLEQRQRLARGRAAWAGRTAAGSRKHGPQVRTQPTLSPSPLTWQEHVLGRTPSVGLV